MSGAQIQVSSTFSSKNSASISNHAASELPAERTMPLSKDQMGSIFYYLSMQKEDASIGTGGNSYSNNSRSWSSVGSTTNDTSNDDEDNNPGALAGTPLAVDSGSNEYRSSSVFKSSNRAEYETDESPLPRKATRDKQKKRNKPH